MLMDLKSLLGGRLYLVILLVTSVGLKYTIAKDKAGDVMNVTALIRATTKYL